MHFYLMGLLCAACSRGFSSSEWADTAFGCFYETVRVAEGASVQVSWDTLPEARAASVDRVIIGQLAFGIAGLNEGNCGPFEETEVIVPAEGERGITLTAADVGPVGTSVVVTLRSGDIEVDSLVIYAARNADETVVWF